MNKEIIYQNVSLRYIIETLTNGTVGFDLDNENIDNFLIINQTVKELQGIIIKPCLINITEQILNFIGTTQRDVDLVDNDFMDFIVFSFGVEINEETKQEQKIMVNQSLSETIIMFESNNINLLSTIGWQLIKIT